jgi:hypothetical protein
MAVPVKLGRWMEIGGVALGPLGDIGGVAKD